MCCYDVRLAGRRRWPLTIKATHRTYFEGSVFSESCWRQLSSCRSRCVVTALFFLGALASGPSVAQNQPAHSVVRSVAEIHELPREFSKVSVEIPGLVANYDPTWRICFFHDGARGIYVDLGDRPVNLSTGQQVILRGDVGPHRYVVNPVFEITSTNVNLPPAIPETFDRLHQGHMDSQFVSLRGVPYSIGQLHGHYAVQIAAQRGKTFRMLIKQAHAEEQDLVSQLGRRVVVEGIAGAIVNQDGSFRTFQLWVPDFERHVHFQATDSLSGDHPVTSIAEVVRATRQTGVGFYRVQGQLLQWISESIAVIQDSSGAIYADIPDGALLPRGSSVEVRGAVERANFSPFLSWCTIEELDEPIDVHLEPTVVSVKELQSGRYDGQIVRVSGRLTGQVRESDGVHLFLDSAGVACSVIVPPVEFRVPRKAQLTVQGVCVNRRSAISNESFEIYAMPDDIEVAPGIPGWLVPAGCAAGGLAVLGMLWVGMLHRQVRRQTKRVREEFELREQSEASFGRVLNNAKVAVLTHDVEGRVLSVNQAMIRATGASEDAILKQQVFDLLDDASETNLRAALHRLAASEEICSVEVRLKSLRGPLPYEVTAWADDHDGASGVVRTIWRDIAERKRLEEEKRGIEETKLRSQKLQSLGVLAGGIAHDFNNILTSILGNASLANSKLAGESPLGDELEEIESAARRAAELTRQMLAYSGQGASSLESIDLSSLVQETLQLLRASIPSTTELKTVLQDDVPTIDGDPGQIAQVIMNLVINAWESLEHDPGVVQVRTHVREVAEADIHTIFPDDNCITPGKHVVLVVQDSGKGMDEATQSRMFDPFYTTKFSGRGLGLASTVGIIRSHGAGICVNSSLGNGTQLELFFPLGKLGAAQEHIAANDHLPAPPSTVLVVDDEPSVLQLVTRILSLDDLYLLTATNGVDALEMFRQHLTEIDCVILDMTMPRLDGATACKEMLRLNPEMPIILCSGYSESAVDHLVADNESVQFVSKPFSATTILSVVRNSLSRSPCNQSAKAAT